MYLGLLAMLLSGAGPVPPVPAAPVLYVNVIAPGEAVKVVFPRSDLAERPLPAPAAVALRPGYHYRFRIDGVEGGSLYPSIDVLGSLHPPKGMNIADHPVPVRLTVDEVRAVRAGTAITKVLILEDPLKAAPLATRADRPIVRDITGAYDDVAEAKKAGRLMLVFRVGDRPYSRQELAAAAVPGTVHYPGEASLPPAARPPHFPPAPPCFPDLANGRPGHCPGECLYDGGDSRVRMAVLPDGTVGGLDPSDAAIEFTAGRRRRVSPSNRVCVCAPRFVEYRSLRAAVGTDLLITPSIFAKKNPPIQIGLTRPPVRVDQSEVPLMFRRRQVPRELTVEESLRILALDRGPAALAKARGVLVKAKVVKPEAFTLVECKNPMILHKWVAPPPPYKVGQVVTFYLRFKNMTPEVMRDVVISDNLTTRLEYVPGTAKCDREALFTFTPNEAGSLLLQWRVVGEVRPGELGVVSFRARIR